MNNLLPELHNIQSDANAKLIVPKHEVLLEAGEVSPVLSWHLTDIKTGKIVEAHGPIKSESFLKGFMQLLAAQFIGWGYGQAAMASLLMGKIRRTDGYYSYPSTNDTYKMPTDAGIGITLFGIQIGAGTTPPVFTDFVMESLIAHGTAAGQLQYGAMYFGEPADTGGVSRYRSSRIFSNNSGGIVTVGEVGLAYEYDYGTGGLATIRPSVLGIRDLFPVPVAIPNGQSLTVNYDIQAAV